MVNLGAILAIIGLIFDIGGAMIIGLPDIPQLRKCHKPGRLRIALRNLETGYLIPSSTGYKDITHELEEMTDECVNKDAEEIFVAVPTVVAGNGPDSGIRRKIAVRVKTSEEEAPEMWEETDFDLLRQSMERKIREREAYIRAIGFIVLGIGLGLQMFGVVM